MHIPRLLISGLSGGAGKTMLSLGLARALARSGKKIRAFKKGPDYIDAAWLSLAARSPQGNLDPFFTPGPALRAIFKTGSSQCDLALIEGNRGLFDGLDIEGSCSSAEVARLLDCPVLLILDCTKMTRTAAALVKGCLDFEPHLRIGGVVLNRTGNARHEALARRAVEELTGVPVLGSLPRQADPFILERHMGLAGADEHTEAQGAENLLETLADFVESHLHMAAIAALGESAPPLADETPGAPVAESPPMRAKPLSPPAAGPRIGYVRDAALWFYYRENLDALRSAGATLLPLSLLADDEWPDVDGLYLGGGVPELHAERISGNTRVLARLAALSRSGLPIYAECGGFMVLADALVLDGKRYPMAGIFPGNVEFHARPQGLGYVLAKVEGDNPFHPKGLELKGHEFHFSRYLPHAPMQAEAPVLRLLRGRGLAPDADAPARDGLVRHVTFASYLHVYAPALPHWAPVFVSLCRGR